MFHLGSEETVFNSDESLWKEYLESKDNRVREALISRNLSLAKRLTSQIYYLRATDDVEYEDYYQYGIVGLIEAIENYHPQKGSTFETYATYRIKGAIYSGLVIQTEKRQQSAYLKRMQSQRLESIIGGSNRGEAFTELLNVTISLAIGHMLDEMSGDDDADRKIEGQLYQSDEYQYLQKQISSYVGTLPQNEMAVVNYHYFHYLSFEHIADILGVTKSRISQIHRTALDRIRKTLNEEKGINISL